MNLAQAFAHFCLTGAGEVPGVKREILELYRGRVFRSTNKNLRRAFPLVARDLTPQEWQQLMEDFLREHAMIAPQVWRMNLELFTYVSRVDYGKKINRPYLNDLLWFEWVGVAVNLMEDLPSPRRQLALNPAHELSHFRYPVFRSSGKALLGQEGDYFLLTYRHPETLKVYFLDLSPPLVLLFEAIQEGAESLEKACEKIGLPFTSQLCEKVDELIQKKVFFV